jgi:hypothetical protein
LQGENPTDRFLLPTVLRQAGIAFRIYVNDHAPPHVHAVAPSGFAKIEIGSAGAPPSVLKVGKGMKDQDLLKAVRVVEREWSLLLAAWRRVHGDQETDG